VFLSEGVSPEQDLVCFSTVCSNLLITPYCTILLNYIDIMSNCPRHARHKHSSCGSTWETITVTDLLKKKAGASVRQNYYIYNI
jgi:hypothetical protein